MGKYGLKGDIGGFASRCDHLQPELLVFLVVLIAVMAVQGEISNFQPPKHPLHKVNISQAEFDAKHKLYFETLERNQRRRLRERGETEDHLQRKRFYRFTHSGIENTLVLEPDRNVPLDYFVDIPQQSRLVTEIEQISLRMLLESDCSDNGKVSIVVSHRNKTIAKKDFEFESCLPRWDSISLPSLPSGALTINLHCHHCKKVFISHPTLYVISTEYPRSRQRRTPFKHQKFPGKCSRRKLEINFEQIPGYDWIVQPLKFDIGLCAGKCPRLHDPANQHATLQGLLGRIDKNVPKPVCAPKTLETLELLHVDPQDSTKLTQTQWKNTVITECACS